MATVKKTVAPAARMAPAWRDCLRTVSARRVVEYLFQRLTVNPRSASTALALL